MSEDAIVVSDLSKVFRLPHEKKITLYESITGMLKGDKGYEDFVALKNINFTVKKGEAVGIIGENGSGKSTLLKIIANILRPSSGSIKINGRITPFLELGVGFQPDLTAKENIYVYGAIMGMSDKEIDAKLEEILEFSGLKQFQDAKLKNLSSGMQVRLAFATAVQTDPEILLMDEVLAVGDMEFQQKCFDVFQRYIKEKKTIVFVSHDLSSIRHFCSKALLMKHGEQIVFGKTNDVIEKYVYGAGNAEIQDDVPNSTDETLKNLKLKWGNKKVEIIDVKLIDKFGQENTIFMSGDTLKIKIIYDSHLKIINPAFGFEIYDVNDLYCFATNTNIKKIIIPEIENQGEMTIDVKSLPFSSGKYFITVAIHSFDHKTTYDWHTKLYSFSVKNKTSDVGFVAIDCDFILNGISLGD
jgi:lipopolysaccharide transport system ATP-binding protein